MLNDDSYSAVLGVEPDPIPAVTMGRARQYGCSNGHVFFCVEPPKHCPEKSCVRRLGVTRGPVTVPVPKLRIKSARQKRIARLILTTDMTPSEIGERVGATKGQVGNLKKKIQRALAAGHDLSRYKTPETE